MPYRRRPSRVKHMPTQTPNIWPPPPPANETDSERARRVEMELEAQKISEEIDHAIELDRIQQRRKAAAKIVLLGKVFPEL